MAQRNNAPFTTESVHHKNELELTKVDYERRTIRVVSCLGSDVRKIGAL